MSDEKKTAAAVDKAPAVQAVAYCGPTIKGVAPQYTVFVDGIPEKLAEIAEEHPVVKALIVPREKTRRDAGESGAERHPGEPSLPERRFCAVIGG